MMESCPCKRTGCARHGDCAACKAHHQGKRPPACERDAAKAERKLRKATRKAK